MAAQRDVLIEFQTVGNAVKVCAIDTETGLEVSIVGPANMGQEQLSRTAVQKLRYMLRKRGLMPASDTVKTGKGRGLLV